MKACGLLGGIRGNHGDDGLAPLAPGQVRLEFRAFAGGQRACDVRRDRVGLGAHRTLRKRILPERRTNEPVQPGVLLAVSAHRALHLKNVLAPESCALCTTCRNTQKVKVGQSHFSRLPRRQRARQVERRVGSRVVEALPDLALRHAVVVA